MGEGVVETALGGVGADLMGIAGVAVGISVGLLVIRKGLRVASGLIR